MDAPPSRRPARQLLSLALPATLAVTTFALTNGCNDPSSEYCEDIGKVSVCESEAGCAWTEELGGYCQNVCHEITKQSECEAVDRCVWDLEGGTETGGGGSCHQPFT